MKYIIAIILPPLGMLLAGRIFLAILCLLLMLTVLGWPLAVIWALLVVNTAENDARTRRLLARQAKEHARQNR
ncbi:MAG TPA: YqaE/Pmp3 family membrane protein [Candidatus Limnocylindria bacterium]|nr:YqaE/Pmp3 family membrane protein [Candidatus Limnocylindria bacterium]